MGLEEGEIDSGTDLTRRGKETGRSQDQSKEGGGGSPPEEHVFLGDQGQSIGCEQEGKVQHSKVLGLEI